jgi:serine/threonine protein kinase
MSPEQARGEKVDHRTDIWSFGVVLYEMITGQLPFKGEYDQAVMYSIMNVEPEPIIPTGSGHTGVPMELERIVNKALAKKANERYQHADEMLVDLQKLKKDIDSGTGQWLHKKHAIAWRWQHSSVLQLSCSPSLRSNLAVCSNRKTRCHVYTTQ